MRPPRWSLKQWGALGRWPVKDCAAGARSTSGKLPCGDVLRWVWLLGGCVLGGASLEARLEHEHAPVSIPAALLCLLERACSAN